MIEKNQQKVERLPLSSDYVFKRVFTKEGNEHLLKDFLEAILEIKIKDLEIQNPELIRETKDGKQSVLDIKVQINDDSIIDVEMQVANEYNIRERSTVYMGKLIANQLNKGDSYSKLKKSILINILNFNYYKRNSYHSVAHMKFEKTTEEKYVDMGYNSEEEIATEDIEVHYIEIPKFIKKNPEVNKKIEQWLWLIVGKEEKIKMAEEKNEEVKKAVEVLDEMSMSKEERERYEAIQKFEFNYNTSMYNIREIGKKEGKKEGKIEGKRENQIEISKKLYELGMDINKISNITGLSVSELKKLLNQNKK